MKPQRYVNTGLCLKTDIVWSNRDPAVVVVVEVVVAAVVIDIDVAALVVAHEHAALLQRVTSDADPFLHHAYALHSLG